MGIKRNPQSNAKLLRLLHTLNFVVSHLALSKRSEIYFPMDFRVCRQKVARFSHLLGLRCAYDIANSRISICRAPHIKTNMIGRFCLYVKVAITITPKVLHVGIRLVFLNFLHPVKSASNLGKLFTHFLPLNFLTSV